MEKQRKTCKKQIKKISLFFRKIKLLKRLLAGRENRTISQEKRREESIRERIETERKRKIKLLLLLLVEFFSGELLLLILLCFFRKSWADFSHPAAERRPAPG
ncbi:hypothetical protein [Bacteroides caccae]|uniref:hypothetical protein n=1 Tax=Bacteroides caccae TaxID=47678 RepID=UPI0034A56938